MRRPRTSRTFCLLSAASTTRCPAPWTSRWEKTSAGGLVGTRTRSSRGLRMRRGCRSTWATPRTSRSSRSWRLRRPGASSRTTSSSAVLGSDYENISPRELKERLDAGDRPALLDVREGWEYDLARIEGSTLVPLSEIEGRFHELDPGAETVVICHHGSRSAHVAQALNRAGFHYVSNLEGGLDAYADVDESVGRY